MADGIVWDDEAQGQGVHWDDAPSRSVPVYSEGHPAPAAPVAKEETGTGWQDKVRAALQGATLGFGDEAVSYLESKYPFLGKQASDLGGQAPAAKTYEQAREENRGLQEGAAQRNPWTAVAGSLLAPIPGVGEVKGLAGVGKLAVQGAGVGAANALGASHEDTGAGLASDAAGGALAGGAIGGVAGALGPIAKALRPQAIDDFLRNWAETRAVKAVTGNGHLKAVKEMRKQGILNKVGRYALDEGVLTPFSTPANHLERSEALNEKAGEAIHEMLDKGDAAARPLISGPDLATKLRRSQVGPLRAGNEADQALANRLEQEAARLEAKGDLGFQEASKYKNTFDKYLKHGAEQAPFQEELKGVRRLIKRDIEEKLDAVGQSVEPGLGDKYKAAKTSYGLSGELADLAKAREEQLLNNKVFGMTAHQAGGGLGALGALGAATSGHGGAAVGLGGMAAAGIGMLGHKLADEFGPQLFATGLNLGSKLWTNTVVRIAKLAPDALGKYGAVLARELQVHGPAGVMAMHHALSGDPQYVSDSKKLHGELRAAAGQEAGP